MGIIDTAFEAVGQLAVRSKKGINNRRTPVLVAFKRPDSVGGFSIVAQATTEILRKRRRPRRFYVRINDTVVWSRGHSDAHVFGSMDDADSVVQMLVAIGEGRTE